MEETRRETFDGDEDIDGYDTENHEDSALDPEGDGEGDRGDLDVDVGKVEGDGDIGEEGEGDGDGVLQEISDNDIMNEEDK
jgi:hypothetical protein